MTKKEAIKKLLSIRKHYQYIIPCEETIAIDMAIEALRADGAGVGRYENAMQKLQEMPKYLNGIKAKQIKKISAETTQGKWIKEYNGNGWDDFWDYTCSNCGKKYERASDILYYANFCPNCGKRMEKISEK